MIEVNIWAIVLWRRVGFSGAAGFRNMKAATRVLDREALWADTIVLISCLRSQSSERLIMNGSCPAVALLHAFWLSCAALRADCSPFYLLFSEV